ncbi:Uncharacterised protein [Mycobacterium tuberculosis]|nr:Uncharacterised protein [Mycobacterium tuberculosis]
MAPPSLNSKRTWSPGLISGKAFGDDFAKPIVMDGHLSVATGPCEMVMPSGATLSTLPSAL